MRKENNVEFRQFGPQGSRIVKVPTWLAMLIAAAMAIAALVIFVIAASAALILLPIFALVALVTGWWFRRKIAKAGTQWPPGRPGEAREADVVDADYVVIEPPRDPGDPRRRMPGEG